MQVCLLRPKLLTAVLKKTNIPVFELKDESPGNFCFVGKPTWLLSDTTRHMNQFAARGAVFKIFARPKLPQRALRISAIMTKKDPQEIISDFRTLVNMTVKELQDWLETDKSQEIGWNPEGGESKGHQSGRYICDLLPKKDSEFTEEDLQHMSHVNAYCKRHLAQRPKNVEDSKWRYSLMNWYAGGFANNFSSTRRRLSLISAGSTCRGHDPTK